jgi:ABC-type multidrug transport system fused ATPase/permease subunit
VILVLRQGSLVATGSHQDLIETCEPYRRIFNE